MVRFGKAVSDQFHVSKYCYNRHMVLTLELLYII